MISGFLSFLSMHAEMRFPTCIPPWGENNYYSDSYMARISFSLFQHLISIVPA